MSVPDTDARVKTTSYDAMTVECYSIYLAEMSAKSMQTTSFRYAPDLGSCIVASRDYNVAFDL